ncbi:Immunoglobulin E-set [Sesbania bispinosa]|nr:Immunoglobulin E-set [Sesbania bispinosa]
MMTQMQNSLLYSRAYWVSESVIAWNVDVGNWSCYLLASKDASLSTANCEIQGEDLKIKLEEDRAGLPANVVEKFPHIRGYRAFNVPPTSDVKSLLRSQLAVVIYDLCVYHPSTLRVEKCYANDPYARGLSSDGKRTFLLNLDSDELKPDGWDNLANEKPILHSFSDISIYEMHIRDFRLIFPSLLLIVGVLHLKKLSSAGITHVHLLPTFQFAGVDDQKENWRFVDQQQALITAVQNFDGYNWGYNPVIWGVPKGSYATNPNGPYRTIEFRKMVQALNHTGLRIVLDTVYNHLQGSYYLRRNADGFIEHSTCMNNTASEHFMVERLILDDLVHWAVNYKIDGFRFDLMGHIMKSTMVKAKNALHCLTKEKDGVDGSSIYIYGEGWDFGEVAKNGHGINASQFNLSGTQIGR